MRKIAKKTSEPLVVSQEQDFKKRSPYIPILIVLLLIASYLLGMLTTKVQYLEKSGKARTTAQAQTGDTVQGAQAPAVPTPTPGKIKPVINKDHIRGNADAPITLVVYSDYECPFCKRFHPTMIDLMKEYDGKIKWVYRQYPLSFHQNAQKEAEASECVAELGGNDKFWDFTDKLFERTTSNGVGFALDQLGPLAAEVGVDQTAFQTCLDSNKYAKFVQDSIADGSKGGVTGTPGTIIIDSKGNQQLLVGAQPIESFKAVIDPLLKK